MKTKLKSSANPSMIKPREAGAKIAPRSSQQPTNSGPRAHQDPPKNQPTNQRTNEKKMTRKSKYDRTK